MTRYFLWNNPSVHCANICYYNWFNKQTDRPVPKHDEVRQEIQTENDGMRKGRVRGVASQMQRKKDEKDVLRKGTKPCG